MKKHSIKFWRQERGLSQYELAAESKVARHRIQLAEQGLLELTPDERERILAVLGIPKSQEATNV
jgi:transcriptional regulator with XRE-family HTH domain